jgi:hypothetical protein
MFSSAWLSNNLGNKLTKIGFTWVIGIFIKYKDKQENEYEMNIVLGHICAHLCQPVVGITNKIFMLVYQYISIESNEKFNSSVLTTFKHIGLSILFEEDKSLNARDLYNDVLVTHDGLMCICAKY